MTKQRAIIKTPQTTLPALNTLTSIILNLLNNSSDKYKLIIPYRENTKIVMSDFGDTNATTNHDTEMLDRKLENCCV
jgi:hypothetical protein